MNKLFIFIGLCIVSPLAYAYLGPGMAGGVFAATIGFFAAFLLALWAVLYYPAKRAIKNRQDKVNAAKELGDEN